MCNICKGWDGLTGNVLCRCPRCSCLCADADVQERNRQEQKFQTTKAAEKFKLIFFFSSYRIRQYSHVSFINAKVGIRAENLDRRESRKPSFEAFSQSRTVASIEPSISTIDDIFIKRVL